ncbi:MAG TPA: BRCT domain-containing protein [Humisphaera sp.]
MPTETHGENADNERYIRFTGPARRDKGLNTLKGLLLGVAADGPTPRSELRHLCAWMEDHADFGRFHPFNELLPKLQDAIDDDVLDPDEVADLLWFVGRVQGEDYYDRVTADMQELQGMLAGVVADGAVSDAEIGAVAAWCDDREHLASVWPYDEIRALITNARADGVVTPEERRELLAFFSEFGRDHKHKAVSAAVDKVGLTVKGVCAVCPDVRFDDRTFCFTGTSTRMKRSDIAARIEARGGRFSKNVVRGLDYLVIGADGNPCWAYSCYGRKVEEAVALRRSGARLVLVHEADFWDAVG